MMLEYVLGGVAVVGALGAVTGWIAAFRARGEAREAQKQANEEAERARKAEAARDTARAQVFDADARAEIAATGLRVAKTELDTARSELARERREKAKLIDDLSKRGVPVGDALVDSSVDRLYEDEDRRSSEARRDPDPGARHDRANVPDDDSAAPRKTRPK
jgi:hypothetical protein